MTTSLSRSGEQLPGQEKHDYCECHASKPNRQHRLMQAPPVVCKAKFNDVGPDRFLQVGIDRPGNDWLDRFGPDFDWCQETVASLRYGLYVERIFGAVAKGIAHLLDGEVHALVEVDECVARPQGRLYLFARHQRAGAICQKTEQAIWLRLDANRTPVLEETLGIEVEFEGTEASHGLPRPSIHLTFLRAVSLSLGSVAG